MPNPTGSIGSQVPSPRSARGSVPPAGLHPPVKDALVDFIDGTMYIRDLALKAALLEYFNKEAAGTHSARVVHALGTPPPPGAAAVANNDDVVVDVRC
jgi:hypothetical protein